LPIDSQPCVSGGEFLDDLVVDMCTNPLDTNPVCIAKSPVKNLGQNGVVLVQNSSVQGGLSLGAEHEDDSVQESDTGTAVDPSVDMLQSSTPRELSTGRHVALVPNVDSPYQLLWCTDERETVSGQHVALADELDVASCVPR
jgi:hypothetical protein